MSARTREDGWRLGAAEIAALVAGTHGDAFAVLGPHLADKSWIARTVIPGADTVEASTLDGKPLGKLERRSAEGFFEGKVALTGHQPIRYRAANSGGQWLFADPYSF